MINPHVLLQLGRERHLDLLNGAQQRGRRILPTESSPPGSGDIIVVGRSARVIDARVRAQSPADGRDAA